MYLCSLLNAVQRSIRIVRCDEHQLIAHDWVVDQHIWHALRFPQLPRQPHVRPVRVHSPNASLIRTRHPWYYTVLQVGKSLLYLR